MLPQEGGGADSIPDAAAAAQSLDVMRLDLEQMQRRRDELQVAMAQIHCNEVVQESKAADLGELSECKTELLEILSASDNDLDAEEQECLSGLAEALLAEPHIRAQTPLPLLLTRLPDALLPSEDAGSQPLFRLSSLEVIALLAHKEFSLSLCERLLASVQGCVLSSEDAVVAVAQRPDLLSLFLRSGRVRVGPGSLEEEHLVAMAEIDPALAMFILTNPECSALLSIESIQRLSRPQGVA